MSNAAPPATTHEWGTWYGWEEGMGWYWPGWNDSGRDIQIVLRDGSLVIGELYASDEGFDGEDEYPMWTVTGDGREVDFTEAERWRFIDE